MPRRKTISHNQTVALLTLALIAWNALAGAGWLALGNLAALLLYTPNPLHDWHDAGGPDL